MPPLLEEATDDNRMNQFLRDGNATEPMTQDDADTVTVFGDDWKTKLAVDIYARYVTEVRAIPHC